MMNFEQTPEFKKDFKRLIKKYRSLEADINYVIPRIESLYTKRDDIDVKQFRTELFATKRAAILPGSSDDVEVVKMRLDVASLQSNSKVRIIFIAVIKNNVIILVELYAKNDKLREDKARIKKYLI